MKLRFLSVAILSFCSIVAYADEPPAAKQSAANSSDATASTDALPEGIRNFNGMLVGRLMSKDVEKGSFVVSVDAVPRVWRNSKATSPKSIVGKSVAVKGVFGRFLDVLVTTRQGETIEFECKYDGEGLAFPGELLRKVAAYDASDYPVLPEDFRGFRGTVVAEINKKDPETFELIMNVEKVISTGEGNSASRPESILGKSMMLAGFWNRKDEYHKLKTGERIQVEIQHLESQSDHLNVAGTPRTLGPGEQPKMERESAPEANMTAGTKGFRGMLVGRLVKKDVERGTFTITVDAVPRVWNNNQASAPKSLIGKNVDAERVPASLLDALVVTRIGDTIEFGALSDGGEILRVGEVLRKAEPVKPGDFPELPDEFRGFNGVLVGKVLKKNMHLWELIVEVSEIKKATEKSGSKDANSIVGKSVMLSGFWNKQDAYQSVAVGDTIEAMVEHPQLLSDHLTIMEGVKKLND